MDTSRSIERLLTLRPALEIAENELERLHGRLAKAVTEDEKQEIAAEVDKQRERVGKLRDNFRTLATGVEESGYQREAEPSATWQQQVEDIIEPISRGMRQITASPREMSNLREELAIWSDRMQLTENATARLDELLETPGSTPVRAELEAAQRLWVGRKAEADSRVQVLKQQIADKERDMPSTWASVSGFFADFWRSRGLNLLLAIVAASVAFIATRRIYQIVRRVSPLHRNGGNDLAARSADLMVGGLAILLAILMVIMVFYLRGDWLLLTLTILAVFGILWGSKQALPPYLDQIRMILNIGPVRQGERLIYQGLPWQVERLNFYCEFRNPELSGGLLRLPIREVMPLHSRPLGDKEPWFPTRADDWVKLADGTFGKVIQQSPDQVTVLKHGGSLKSFPTALFLEQTPENLSRGFRVNVKFGIDYRYQAISTIEVPEVFKLEVRHQLENALGSGAVVSVKVELASASSSSLDYAILADFTGDVASRYNVLERLIQKACVDVCNDRGWVIPFTQITVHQA
jgi:small-conductance mechanosensitive channel